MILSVWSLGWEVNSLWLFLLPFPIMKHVSDTRESDIDSSSVIGLSIRSNSTGRDEKLIS